MIVGKPEDSLVCLLLHGETVPHRLYPFLRGLGTFFQAPIFGFGVTFLHSLRVQG